MTEERFWTLVYKSGWHRFWKYDRNVEICRRRLLEALSEGELDEFAEMVTDKMGELQERITSYYREVSGGEFDYLMPEGFSPNGYIGDDTLSDGLYHIVGRGKTYYNQVMKNPDKFWTNFKDVYEMMMSESFVYVTFPDDV